MISATLIRALLVSGLLVFSVLAVAAHDGFHAGDATQCDYCLLLGHGAPAPCRALPAEVTPEWIDTPPACGYCPPLSSPPTTGRYQRAPPLP